MPLHRRTTALVLAGVGMTIPPMVRATDTPALDAGVLEEVVVTANRRSERPLDVGASVGVISAADIDRLHATSLVDLSAAVPGLSVISQGSPGQTTVVLRGLPSFVSSSAGGSLIATVVDDVAVGSSGGWAGDQGLQLDLLPYDIERIEILQGPQGTLYGASSMAGVLKYVTRDPNLTARETQVGADLFDVRNGGSVGTAARGAWSGPLIDQMLAMRGSFYAEGTPGYIDNPLREVKHENSLSQYGGRVALLWQPFMALQVRLQGIYQTRDSNGNASAFAEQLGNAQQPYYRPGGWLGGYLIYPHVVPEPFSTDVKFISGTIDWHTERFTLVSVTGYTDRRIVSFLDSSQVYGYLQPVLDPSVTSQINRSRGYSQVRRASQELRLVSQSGRRFEWLAGAYYDNERSSLAQYYDALDSQLNPIPSLDPFYAGHWPSTYTETALFGTLTYRIVDQFDLTAGVRWLTNKQHVEEDVPANFLSPESHWNRRSADQSTTYEFGARYRPQPDTMAYLRIASGFRPGTPNSELPGYPQIPAETQPDSMVNYEVGVKSELMQRKASMELAAFRIYWSDPQIYVPTEDGQYTYGINAGKVTSTGVELSATYWPITALHVAIAAAYAEAFATEAVPAAFVYEGTRLPNSPQWTAATTVDYQLTACAQWTPHLSATWRYIGSQYTTLSTAPPPVGLIPGYSWVDAEFRMTKGGYDIALYAKNLLDKQAFNQAVVATANTAGPNAPVPPGPPLPAFGGTPLQPRVVGLSVTLTL